MRESVHSARPVHPLRKRPLAHSAPPPVCLSGLPVCDGVVLRWQPSGSPASASISIKTCATETPSCPHYVAFQGRHGYPADQAGNAANKPELCFHCELHGGRGRGLCSGGLSLIIAPGTRDRACMQLRSGRKK